MKIAYCDCFSGISGDMFLAALLDVGLPLDVLKQDLGLLKLDETWSMGVKKVQKGPVQATTMEIKISESHHHRHLADIHALIEPSALSDDVKKSALAIFDRLAEAEALVHGTTVENIHFHEVGAVDSILDIVGAAIGLDFLEIGRLYSSAVPLGSGQVKTQHGILPIPAPATLTLLVRAGAHITPSPANSELVTPTGAAILATMATFDQPNMTLTAVGTGAGQRELAWPNILRLIVGETEEIHRSGVVLIETNIDDMNPEFFGHVLEKLFSTGALDVFMTPIYMKKNRPAAILSVIARRVDEPMLAQLLLRETTTFGVRVQPLYRYEANRDIKTVQTEYGLVPVKIKYIDGKQIQAAPEYDSCTRLANENNVPILNVYQAALLAVKDI